MTRSVQTQGAMATKEERVKRQITDRPTVRVWLNVSD